MTVNRSEFLQKQGERYELAIPKESEILPKEGHFSKESVNKSEYKPKKGDRYEVRRYEPADLWKVRMLALHNECIILLGC